jgi:hypothetical protein
MRARSWCTALLALSLLDDTTKLASAEQQPARNHALAESARPLPELPLVPALEPPRPDAADLADVDGLLGRLLSQTESEREQAIRELLEATPKQVSAIRFRVSSIADSADKDAMKRLMLKARREALKELADREESEKSNEGVDYLARLSASAEPSSEAWRNLISVLGLCRMLEAVGTVEAVRGVIEVYVRYGEFLRLTVQRALARLGDKAIPALIEAERHPAEKISKWAARQLDMLGKAIPSEAVTIADQAVLADVLRAYGRTRDLEALRIVASFANSERAQVREAARQAIALFGESGAWQLRDSYENVVGKKPPRDWGWERTARELFAEFDRLRTAEGEKLLEQARAARARGDLPAMKQRLDALLARHPHPEGHREVAAAYVSYAQQHADIARADAIAALRKAERLDPQLKAAQSLRLTLEAEQLDARGIADLTLLERARELDPHNARAAALLARLELGEPRRTERTRIIAAACMLGAAFLAIAMMLTRRAPT